MKLRIEFGVPPVRIKEVKWYDELMKMHRVLKMDGKYWEWIAHNKSALPQYDHILIYGEVRNQINYVGLEVPDFELVFGWQAGQEIKCECGAVYNRGFENFHSYWCPRWEKT